MAAVSSSGEVMLSNFLQFVVEQEHDILSGKVTVKLHPRALEYLASRLQVLEELERLRQLAPVDFFRGAFTDLEDYTRLHKLQQVLSRVRSLFVASTVCHLRDPTRVNLLRFQSLTNLELRGCDLSTSAWLGLANVQCTLRSLTCQGSLEELQHLLAPYSRILSLTGERSTPEWPQLVSLRCKQNCFVAMDSSLQLLPAVRLLDLSNNNISELQNLHACSSLTDLNLSYNNIVSLSPLRDCAGQLQRLILQGNAIRSIRGLHQLTSLTELDLRCNLLASYQEFSQLTELSNLRSLWLEGNPLSYAPFYRLDVLAWFDSAMVKLDGVPTRREEASAVALRAAGEMPLAWRVMADYISQQQLLWRPPEISVPRPEPGWVASNVTGGRSPSLTPGPPLRPIGTRAGIARRAPSRRIVEFSGDPLAALADIERPSSPSPFVPLLEEVQESSSRASSVSGARLPVLRSFERLKQTAAQTVYRSRQPLQPCADDNTLPVFQESILDALKEIPVPHAEDEGMAESDSDDSSSCALTSVSSRGLSRQSSPTAFSVPLPG